MNINLRVYSFLEHNNKLLTLREPFNGELVYKLPGGGLEYGEGTIDCLKREYKEELNIEIEVKKHLYTLDYFIPSKRNPNEQLLFVYYLVEVLDLHNFKVMVPEIVEFNWIEINQLTEDYFSLQADKSAFNYFLNHKTKAN